jgi:Na+/H+-dicarboxylate symporter/ABC-type amino acid transport substrate-binding protein
MQHVAGGIMATGRKRRMSLSTQVLVGLVVGLLAGVCFGEYMEALQEVGKAFILLLQMPVLPYITLSLITGLGQLNYQQVKMLALKVGSLLVLSWGLALAALFVMPLTFPVWQSASFFSTSLVTKPEEVNFLTLFIPANPFYSFANNLVPAVVLFSAAIGLALSGIEQKQGLLAPLMMLNRAVTRVTHFVAALTPIGVFAVVASAAGTMRLEDLAKLQVYLWTYIAIALVFTLWVLPALIMSCTPLTYRQVVGQTQDILVTAFATGSSLIVLPLLIERSKDLLRHSALSTETTEATVEVIVPAFTSFPKIGTLLPMSFVLFAGWFAGAAVPIAKYPVFAVTGLVSFFGSVNVAMPLLLDVLRIPVDLFQLYLPLTVITSRLAVLTTVMNNLVLTLLGACAVSGLLTVRWGRLLRVAVLTVVIAGVLLAGLRAFFTVALDTTYRKEEIIADMQLLRSKGPAVVYRTPQPAPADDPQQSRLARLRSRGVLRVGYLPESLPFAYFNAAGDLVGFDIEMAHTLAHDLEVQLEFVPMRPDQMAEQLQAGDCDIIMSGVVATPKRAYTMAFSASYLDETIALIVKDHRREEFSSRAAIHRLKGLRLGVPNVPYYIDKVHRYLPQAELVLLNSISEFFEGRGEDLDALVYTAEAGSAWTLLYPAYTVAIPQPDVLAAPLAYPLARGDQEMVDFINLWIELKKKDKTITGLYDYWILGKHAVPESPRWSVIRNVLHWVQ